MARQSEEKGVARIVEEQLASGKKDTLEIEGLTITRQRRGYTVAVPPERARELRERNQAAATESGPTS